MLRRNARLWTGVLALHAMAWHAGCLHEASQRCGDRGVCPPGSQCTDTGAAQLCILLTCGNGRLDLGEVCDDGNNQSGDGCPADCSEPCGDGVLDPDEICDDGNRLDGDGCSADCRALDGIALVSPPAVAFAAGEGDAPPASVTVSVRLAHRGSVQLEGAPAAWLAVTEEPATPHTAAFRLQVADTSVTGRRSTSVQFTMRSEDGTPPDHYDLPVTYQVEPSDLTVQATATEMDFAATSAGPLPSPRTVDVTFNGAAVTVVSAPFWLTVSAPAPAASPASFSIAVNTTIPPGPATLEGDVVFATTRGRVERRTAVHVRYQLAASLTDVRFIAPYVGIAGRGGTLRVRGGGFRGAGPSVTVGVGDAVLGPVLPDSDTQITVSYPPLPEGRYPVTLNGSGPSPARPELVVVAATPTTYQAIEAHGPWGRIVYDAERRTIYGANQLDHQIERVAYAGGTWSKLSPLAIPQLTDLALAPDGRSLIVLEETALSAMSLTDGVFTQTLLATVGDDPACGRFLYQIAATDNGQMFVVPRLQRCSGFVSPYVFDPQIHALVLDGHHEIYNGLVGGSADGSRIYAGSELSVTIIFESLSSTAVGSFPEGCRSSISVSGDASRVLLDGMVYSRSLTHLGDLPRFRNQALASYDATHAVMYAYDSAGDRLEIYDLNAPVQSDGQYPLLGTVMLPDPANGPGASIYSPVTMAASPDDGVVFISGDSKLLVVPMP